MSRGAAKIEYHYFEKEEKKRECLVTNSGQDQKLKELIANNKILSIHSSEPTLNDIFIDITGRSLQ